MLLPAIVGTAVAAALVVSVARPRSPQLTAVDIVKLQLRDLMRGNTRVAYQLASKANRRVTAAPTGHNEARFDAMVRRHFKEMLQADDFALTCENDSIVNVVLFKQEVLIAAFKFTLSRQQGEGDRDESLGRYALPDHSNVWRTDSVVRLDEEQTLQAWKKVRDTRQEQLRRICFRDAWKDPKLAHSFGVDGTHNMCCRLGPKARAYADESGNPIGAASRNVNAKGEFTHWSTCMGSNVCGSYAERFHDGTKPLFATDPDLTKLAIDIAPTSHCEARAQHELNTSPHATPGVETRGDPTRCKQPPRILKHSEMDEWLRSHHGV